ncbi:hypothetical protein WDZ92_50715, partial [Nostoc sp. NIES-2111]
ELSTPRVVSRQTFLACCQAIAFSLHCSSPFFIGIASAVEVESLSSMQRISLCSPRLLACRAEGNRQTSAKSAALYFAGGFEEGVTVTAVLSLGLPVSPFIPSMP